MGKAFKTNNLQDIRLKGVVNKTGLHETEGKLFFLVQKGKDGGHDWVFSIGKDPSGAKVWSESQGCYIDKEIFGLKEDVLGDFNGAYPMSYQMAQYYMGVGPNQLEMVSVDEALKKKK